MRHVPAALVSRYARSLFAAAREQDALPQVHADVQQLGAVWHGYPELVLVVMNPRLSRAKVSGILCSLLHRVGAHNLSRRFVDLLLDKDRLDVLYDVGAHFDQLWRDHQGEINVTVLTAVPLEDPLRDAISSHVAARSGRVPQIHWKCDPSLLGGIVIEWPHHVFDGSLARKLENLRLQLAQGPVPAAAGH